MPEMPLTGRVALVTGASRRIGIGAAVARRLAAAGADLLLHAWVPHDAGQPWGADPDAVDALAAELRAAGRRVEVVHADFADPAAPATVVDAAVDAFGHLDVLVANHARSSLGTLEEVDAAELDLSYAVNTRATVLLVQRFAAAHGARPGGRVVLFTSGQYRRSMARELAYAASKGALHQLTASLAAHLAPRGITVNCVNPGPTDTGWATPEITAAELPRLPMGRWGEPDDAARLVAWLAGDDARWVTGQVIASEGGYAL